MLTPNMYVLAAILRSEKQRTPLIKGTGDGAAFSKGAQYAVENLEDAIVKLILGNGVDARQFRISADFKNRPDGRPASLPPCPAPPAGRTRRSRYSTDREPHGTVERFEPVVHTTSNRKGLKQ
jgi:hypothetical protein